MWILLDVAVVLIVLLSIIAGYRKGFVKTSFKFGMLVAAFIIANSFSPMFSQYLQTTDIYESITNDIRSKISSSIFDEQQEGTQQKQGNSFEILSKIGIDIDSAVDSYNDAIKQSKEDAVKSLDKHIVTPICRMLADAVSFVALLVASLVALTVLMFLLELVFKLPVLKTVNKSAGAIVGILFGLFRVFVLCVVIQLVLPYIPENNLGFYSGVEEKTYIYKVVVDTNPLSFIYK